MFGLIFSICNINSDNKGFISELLFIVELSSLLEELLGNILSIFSIKITVGESNLLNKKIDFIKFVLLSGICKSLYIFISK